MEMERQMHRTGIYRRTGQRNESKDTGDAIKVLSVKKSSAGSLMCSVKIDNAGGKVCGLISHSQACPSFEEQLPANEIFETGIKVVDLLAPT